jgi:hypothetical protein
LRTSRKPAGRARRALRNLRNFLYQTFPTIGYYIKVLIAGGLMLLVPPGVVALLLCFTLWLLTKPILWKWYWGPFTEWWSQWETFIFILVALPFILYSFWMIPKRQRGALAKKVDSSDYRSLEPKDRVQLEKDLAKLESDARQTLAQIFGGAFLLLGLYFTAENLRVNQNSATATAINAEANVRVAQERLISERFTQAVQQLGRLDQPNENNLALRLGAIQTLEQLAWSPTIIREDMAIFSDGPQVRLPTPTGIATGVLTYHEPIMRILSAFFRANASDPAYQRAYKKAKKAGEEFPWPPPDLAAILKVLSRRQITSEPRTTLLQRLDLSHTVIRNADLFGANLQGADLTGVDLSGSNLEKATLKDALLEGVTFDRTILKGVDFTGAEGIDWEYVKSAAVIDENTVPPTGRILPPPQ